MSHSLFVANCLKKTWCERVINILMSDKKGAVRIAAPSKAPTPAPSFIAYSNMTRMCPSF